MEVNDKGSLELSIPHDVFRAKILMDNAATTNLLHGPRNRVLNGLVQSTMAHTLPSPAHEKHMADPSCAVEEVSLGKIDRAEKDGNSRSLNTLEDPIDVSFGRNLTPEFRSRSLPDDCVSEGGTRNLEWCAGGPTRADRSAVMIQVQIELHLEPFDRVRYTDQMAV